jgi:diguanylate cyclase (GGDEF)-like protein
MSSWSSDLAARRERLRAISSGRVVTALLLALLLGTVARDLTDPAAQTLLSVTLGVHLVVQALALLASREGRLVRVAAEVALVVDVAALAVLMAATGGTASPLGALLLTEVVAVTLLFGRWAGLRVSLLSSLVVAWLLASSPPALSAAATAVREVDPAVALALEPAVRATLLLTALWATTLVTGWLTDVIERDLRRRTEDLTLLREVTPDLDPRRGTAEVARTLAGLLVDRLGYHASAVWLIEGERLVLAAHALPAVDGAETTIDLVSEEAIDAAEAPPRRTVPLDDPTIATALAGTRIHPVRRDQERPDELGALFGPRAPLALAPLNSEGRVVGFVAVEVGARLGRGPTLRVREVRLLRMLAEQAALLLENARMQSELADQAVTDAVTGLPNHRFLQQRLGEELDRLARGVGRGEDRVLSVALLDLDHFKVVNDTYGHPTGDRVLASVAAAAQRTLRGSDVVCRYGGEEFAIILPDTDAVSARLACDRVRRAISDLHHTAVDGRAVPPVTASLGVVTLGDAVVDRSAVLARADAALYAAKRAGRDRVVHDEDRELELPGDGARPGGAGARS